MRRKKLIVLMAVAGVAAAAALLAPPQSPPAPGSSAAVTPSRPEGKDAGLLGALPERETLGRQRGEPFAAPAPVKPAAAAPAPVPSVVAPPAPPPMPYRVAGRVVRGGSVAVVLAKGDAVLPVRPGDSLDGEYRVEAIEADKVTLLYLPLNVRESLAIASNLPPEPPAPARSAQAQDATPAQLRWEGPREVRAGDKFDVVLKVTSAQPLRASPLQLVFDAKLLEAVDVRAGGFFAGGMFSYRVNPAGSIFVGAAGKGAVAADAELLVVTFRSIQAGATAELKLSSVLLQGAAGRTIALDRPTVFRTTIVQ